MGENPSPASRFGTWAGDAIRLREKPYPIALYLPSSKTWTRGTPFCDADCLGMKQPGTVNRTNAQQAAEPGLERGAGWGRR